MDFNAVHTAIVGRDVPTVEININGLKGEAYFDTAAGTSVAGYSLFQKLKEKDVEFQKVSAEIILADGIPKQEMVYSTIVQILIGKCLRRIRFICLPKARDNRTLIGIDFLEQAGIVLDLAQRNCYFKDDPKTVFEFKMEKPKIKESLPIKQLKITEINSVDNFLNWFESTNSVSKDGGKTPKNEEVSSNYEFSPMGINKIFANCIPENTETDVYDWDLFPPMKRSKSDENHPPKTKSPIEILSLDLKLRDTEGKNLSNENKNTLNNLLNDFS